MTDMGVVVILQGMRARWGPFGVGYAPDFVARDATGDPIEVFVWKIISSIVWSINGLCGCNHEHPGWLISNGPED